MRIRFVLAISATLALAACGESTTAPQKLSPGARSADMIECRGGYIVATREDGTTYCQGDGGPESLTTRPDSTGQ